MVPAKTFMFKGVSADLGVSPEKKTDYVSVVCQIVGGEYDGEQLVYKGYYTDKTKKRTIESLKYLGCTFPGNDPTNFEGLGTTTAPGVVEHETFTGDDGNERTYARIAWINNPVGGIAAEQRMDDAQKAAFKARMLGTVASVLGANGTQKTESKANVPF